MNFLDWPALPIFQGCKARRRPSSTRAFIARVPSPAGRILYVCASLFLAGCAVTSTPPRLVLSAETALNRDGSGASLSVVVRTYQLRDRRAFDRLGFDVFGGGRSDAEIFGAELLSSQEFVLTPGARLSDALPLHAEARYVGIVGLFMQPDGELWRGLVDAQATRKLGLQVRLQECYLRIESPAPLKIPGQTEGRTPSCPAGRPS